MTTIVFFQLDNFSHSPFARHLANLAPVLQSNDCNVLLFSTNEQGMSHLPAGMRGFIVGRWLPTWLRLPRHYFAIPELVLLIWRVRPDAIVARGIPFGVPALIASFFCPRRPKIIVTLHSSITGDIKGRVQRSWPVFKHLARFVVRNADHTAAVSAAVARDYTAAISCDPKRVGVLYNPIVGPALLSLASEPVDHSWFEPNRSHLTLLHVGRFAPEKDHDTLLSALQKARIKRDIRLVLIGDGPLREQIEKSILSLALERAVLLLGRVDNPFKYMRKANALVLSSRFEGLPGVLIQAMAVGCPVVSTDCEPGGAREILNNGQFGPLVGVGDTSALAAAILTLVDSPLHPEKLIERAQLFTAEASSASLLRLIR